MFKRSALSTLCICLLASSLSADYSYDDQNPGPDQDQVQVGIQPKLEARAGYFFFGESKMRDVYDSGGLDLQISGSYPIWRWFQVYAAAEFIERHGHSRNGHQKTRLWEWPFSLGLQAVATIFDKMQYYATIGPRYFYVHIHNNSPYVDRKMNHSGVGGFVGTGFHFFPVEHFLVDIFGEYSYCRLHFNAHKHGAHGESAQVGGFTFGGGLGYAF